MASVTLTAELIRSAPVGAVLRDTEIVGLHVRVFAKCRTYYLYYRVANGTERRPKIGNCSIITLSQAREKARHLLAQVTLGLDPGASFPNRTINELFDKVYAERWSGKKSAIAFRRIYLHHVAPRLGNREVRNLCYSDIARFHHESAAAPILANRSLALVSTMFNMAERYGWRNPGSNPCRQVPRYRELSRRRVAKSVELARLQAVLTRYMAARQQETSLVLLVLLCGARPAELLTARRTWLDGSVLRLPDSKIGPRDIYLPPQALNLLNSLPATGTAYFTTTRGKLSRFWRRVSIEAGCPDLRLYDLRRTFATIGMAATKNVGLVGELLGHTQAQTTKIYARAWDAAAVDAANEIGAIVARLLDVPLPEAPNAGSGSHEPQSVSHSAP